MSTGEEKTRRRRFSSQQRALSFSFSFSPFPFSRESYNFIQSQRGQYSLRRKFLASASHCSRWRTRAGSVGWLVRTSFWGQKRSSRRSSLRSIRCDLTHGSGFWTWSKIASLHELEMFRDNRSWSPNVLGNWRRVRHRYRVCVTHNTMLMYSATKCPFQLARTARYFRSIAIQQRAVTHETSDKTETDRDIHLLIFCDVLWCSLVYRQITQNWSEGSARTQSMGRLMLLDTSGADTDGEDSFVWRFDRFRNWRNSRGISKVTKVKTRLCSRDSELTSSLDSQPWK